MVRVLLNTCVISELQKPQASLVVRARVEQFRFDELFLSVITLGEVTKGIMLLPDGRRKRELSSWLLGLEQHFTDQILSIDLDIARLWGELTARSKRDGVHVPANDGLIAATAIRHGLYVMTRNTKDFAATGALILDPWIE